MSETFIGVHDATDWIPSFGSVSMGGFGDGDALSLEPPSEVVKTKVGAMGAVMVSVSKNRIYMMKINLHQTSPANANLRAHWRETLVDTTKVLQPAALERISTGETWRGMAVLLSDAPFKVAAEGQNVEWSFAFIVDNPGA